ncbi:MAG: iron uptake porin, partial [Halothece sp. Uz-M2-17]|nr:iron uptake porin [Halothece sp. Uz-M2-17]
QEFEAELATLGTRVDNLEGRVGFLEDNQFSTTTKLNGSVVFMNTIAFGDEKPNGGDVDSNISFLYDAVLDFEASFTGRDELKVSFQAADFGTDADGSFVIGSTGTADAALDNADDTNGSFELEDLIYTFPLGNNVQVAIGANDMDPDQTFEYNFGSGGEINDFTQDDIVTLDGTIGFVDEDGTGISTNIALTDKLSFGVGYTVNQGDSATDSEVGLFKDYNLAANLNYGGDNFDIGLGYNLGQDGTNIADIDGDGDLDSADITQQAIGLRGAFRLGSRTEIGGWATYVDLDAEAFGNEDEADGWTFGANLAFFDIGKEGSKLGLAFASPTYFDDVDGNLGFVTEDNDRTYVAEVSYDFPVNDNISLTPGFFAVFNPDGDADNDTVYVGVVRTSFSF